MLIMQRDITWEQMMADVFNGLGIPVRPLERDEFLKVRETLTRVGILDGETLKQTCFIFHKRGQYSLMHHLEMRMIDGEDVEATEEDIGHRNSVAFLLNQWGLLEVDSMDQISSPRSPVGGVAVIPFKEKSKYTLQPMYEIGKVR